MDHQTSDRQFIEKKYAHFEKNVVKHYVGYFRRYKYNFYYLDKESFNTAISRVQYIEENHVRLPAFFPEQWYELLVMDDAEYDAKVMQLIGDRKEDLDRAKINDAAEAALRRINALRVNSLCKKYGISEQNRELLIQWNIPCDSIQKRVDTILMLSKMNPALELNIDMFIREPENHIRKAVAELLK